jgi:psiF repeat
MLKPMLIAACLALPFAAVAQDKKMTPQQEKMAACNKDAGAKKLTGDERKKFMSDCLSGDAPSAAQKAQQEKMTACNKEAGTKNLAGDERKKFMSSCLKA